MRFIRILVKTLLFLLLMAIITLPYLCILMALYSKRKLVGPRLARFYFRLCLAILRGRIEVQNRTFIPTGVGQSTIILSNHASFLDIIILSAVFGTVFVSKEEVKRYPFFGMFSQLIGVVFLKRESHRERAGLIRALSTEAKGRTIAIFPQGTTSRNEEPLPFKRGIFKVVELNPEIVLLPVTLYYERHGDIFWARGQSLLKSFFNVCSMESVDVKVIVHRPFTVKDYETRDVDQVSRDVEGLVLSPLKGKHSQGSEAGNP
jgi:1-acyl-sn-glycerol-3-phosphate acyltransferase